MFDPRDDIIGLFSGSRIGAASKYNTSTTSVYVRLVTWEDNENAEPNDYGNKYVGIIWLRPPRVYLDDITVNFSVTEHETITDCELIIPKNDQWLQGSHAAFINNIIHTFETTIRTNATTTGKSWGSAELLSIPISFDAENPNIHRRIMELRCIKAN